MRIILTVFTLALLISGQTPVHAAPKLQAHHQTCVDFLSNLSSRFKSTPKVAEGLDWKTELPADVESLPLKAEWRGEEMGAGAAWQKLGIKAKVKYLSLDEARLYQLKIEDGAFSDLNGNQICPSQECRGSLTVDMSGRIYFSTQAESGKFQHSSFNSGNPVAFAGEAIFYYGRLMYLNKESGHYRPGFRAFPMVIQLLEKYGVTDYEIGIPVSPNPELYPYEVISVSIKTLLAMFELSPDVMEKGYILKAEVFQDLLSRAQRK